MTLPPDDALALARVSPLIHFESCVLIEDKLKKRIRPKANVFQRRLFEAYETLLPIAQVMGLQIRILGLKIRQCGGTTASVEIVYHHLQRFCADAVVMANVAGNSAEMLRKIKLTAETDSFPWGNKLDPTAIKLEWQNGSRAELTSAETNKVGISRTRQVGLFSESCKYPRGGVRDDKAIMASMLPSLGGEGTVAIAESTPEGADGWFYEQWHGNKDQPRALTLDEFIDELKKGNTNPGNGWVKVFAGWFEFEENVVPVRPEQAESIMKRLTPREMTGVEKYNWTVEQIAWRRAKMKSECGGSEALFDEYYPEDEVSCIEGSIRVPTQRGLIPIKEVAPGDISNGRTILNTQCTGQRDTVILTTQQGFRVTCTPEHRIACDNGWSRADSTLNKAIQLVAPHFAEQPHTVAWQSFGGVQSSLEITKDWGLWLGVYMGDGSFYKNQLSIACDAKDRDSVAKITRLSRKLFGHIITLRRPKHAKGIELRSYSSAFKLLFQALDILKPCHHGLMRKIHVPECIWRSPKEVIRQFLRGLFETDGWVSATGRTAQLFAKDPEFLRQVQQLLLGFDIQASLVHRIAKVNGNFYPGGQLYIYNSQIDTFIEEIGFLSARKTARCAIGYKKQLKSGRKRRITQGIDVVASIEPGPTTEVYDLEMNGEPAFAAGGIKVHNCFLSSGRPRFNMASLVALEQKARSVQWEEGMLDLQPNDTVVWSGNTSGWAPFKVCEKPKIGMKYLLSCDPMTGEDQTESSAPDRHSIQVIRASYHDGTNYHKPAVVARVKSPYFGEADQVGQYIEALSRYYGDCIVILEINMGLHILEHLKARGVNLYVREVPDPYDRDKPKKMYGFRTKDADTRRFLIDSLAIAIRDEDIDLNDQNIIDECKTFVVNKNGKPEARPGCKDDDVMALAMGIYAIGAATTYVQAIRRRKKPADWKNWKGWR